MSDPNKKPHMLGGNWKDRISLDPEEQLEADILKETGVHCGIKIEPERITIATESKRDYYLARSEVMKRTILLVEPR